MKIAILSAPQTFEIADEPVPAIQTDEVLVRVAACGVCTSELDMWEGKAGPDIYPRYPGHEVSGTVEKIGEDVGTLKPGDAVGVWVTGRGFAEYVAVKAAYCYPAGDVPLELALAERSEEHTSELQSQSNLVCRLLLEKKKITYLRVTKVRLLRGTWPAATVLRRPDR